MTKIFITGVVVISLSGCMTQDKRAGSLKEYIATIPACTFTAQCNAMWEASQSWIVRNSGLKLEQATDVLLQTYTAPIGSSKPAVRITKKPVGSDGRYQFMIHTWCSHPRACDPGFYEAALNFNRTIGPIQSGLAPLPLP